MNLKDAFRYKNFLNQLSEETTRILGQRSNQYQTTRLHKIHDANPDGQDRTEVVEPADLLDINTAMKLYMSIIEKLEQLNKAINEAKRSLNFDLDATVQANNKRRNLANSIRSILKSKSHEAETCLTGYKFNNEGVQNPYVYVMVETTTERFDRTAFKQTMDDLLKKSDEVSTMIDTAMVNTTVNYDMPWSVNSEVEDILVQFAKTNA